MGYSLSVSVAAILLAVSLALGGGEVGFLGLEKVYCLVAVVPVLYLIHVDHAVNRNHEPVENNRVA